MVLCDLNNITLVSLCTFKDFLFNSSNLQAYSKENNLSTHMTHCKLFICLVKAEELEKNLCF